MRGCLPRVSILGILGLVYSLGTLPGVCAPPPQAQLSQTRTPAAHAQSAPSAVASAPRPAFPATGVAGSDTSSHVQLHPLRNTLLVLALALFLAVLVAAVRLWQRFRSWVGLGILRCPFTYIYTGFIAVMAAITGALVSEALSHFSLMNALFIGGGGGGAAAGGHALAGVVGRLRGLAYPAAPGQAPRSRSVSNGLLDFVYEQIHEDLDGRMQSHMDALARRFDWITVKSRMITLIEDEKRFWSLSPEQAQAAITEIEALPSTSDSGQELQNKITALKTAMGVSSYQRVKSRLEAGLPHKPS
jgi:hypothetical protein